MDNKKKYNEALERARVYRDNARAVEDYAAVARYENIFPELQESKDEKTRKQLISICNEWLSGGLNARPCLNDVRWLKNLLEKQKEQKPAWSEEDEKMIDTIVSVLGQYIDYKAVSGTGTGYATPRYSKEIDWLKSLRPSWKPSKEQIEALEKAVVRSCSHDYGVFLSELYEQLKKL